MLKKTLLDIDVVEAAKIRIIELFKNNDRIALSTSGGKDSIVLSDIVYKLCISGKIDPNKLIVQFIDEEAMFDDVINIVKDWRVKFMDIGAKFEWYCIQVKHFNCLNSLSDEENFICWDETKKDVWIREKPRFAISKHNLLIDRKDNYQSFLDRWQRTNDIVTITGVRAAESIQRLKYIAKTKKDKKNYRETPIYDMTDKDVWLYIMRNDLQYPETYENLYRVGTSIGKLRISQFFSIDTAHTLVKLGETNPDLMNRVTAREPNAYLCMMYWDTEMFGKTTRKRKELEVEENKNYVQELIYLIRNYEHLDLNDTQKKQAKVMRSIYLKNSIFITNDIAKEMVYCITVGDPKTRKKRALLIQIGQQSREMNNND